MKKPIKKKTIATNKPAASEAQAKASVLSAAKDDLTAQAKASVLSATQTKASGLSGSKPAGRASGGATAAKKQRATVTTPKMKTTVAAPKQRATKLKATAMPSKNDDNEALTPEVIEGALITPTDDEFANVVAITDIDLDALADVETDALASVDKSITAAKKSKLAKSTETSLVPSSAADPVARYLSEIRKYPLLTKEEEYKLAVKYRETGDREAAQKLVTSNLRFVVKIAMEYSKFGAKMIDLIQEGNMGLMQAVKDFNPYKGVRLITYAVWWIRGHIQEFLMRHYSMVRIGTTHNQRKLFYELQRSRAQLERMGMEAGIMQISGRLGIPEDEVKSMSERVLQRDVSFDKPTNADDTSTLHDRTSDVSDISAEDELGHKEELELLTKNIEQIRPQLNAREIFILESRVLADEPITLQEIGDHYGITREAARQLEARLISKIKKQMLSATNEDAESDT